MTKEKKVFKCFDEFKKFYFPKLYKEDKEKELTPEQLGSKMAKETIQKIFKHAKLT